MMSNARAPMTILQQAQFIDDLVNRCRMSNGTVAAETFALLTSQDVDDLAALARRLLYMAPHESQIRKLVTGR